MLKVLLGMLAAGVCVGIVQPSNAAAPVDPWRQACERFYLLSGARRPALLGEPALARLDDHFRRGEAVGFSGGAFIHLRDRLLLNRGYGFAEWEASRPMTPDTVFDIGSVSKQFTAAAILKLEEQGRLRTDDRIDRYFRDVPEDKRGITIHQLLTHTAGFALAVPDALESRSRDDMVGTTLASRLRFAPGERYAYSNSGYNLLAAVIEIASGQTYEDYMQRHLWRPAGLTNTGWAQVDRPDFVAAFGYLAHGAVRTPRPSVWVGDGPTWGRRGSGAILSTMNDLRRWAVALRYGSILAPASLGRMISPHVREDTAAPSYYGYGWAISAGVDGSCTVAHDGSNGIHYNVLRFHPERELITHSVSLQARSPLRSPIMGRAARILLAGEESPLPFVRSPGAEAARNLAGRWRSEDGLELELIAVGGRVIAPSRQIAAWRLLTGFKPLSREEADRVLSERGLVAPALDALYRGDYEPLAQLLPDGESIEDERVYWLRQWARWTDEHGAYLRALPMVSATTSERLTSYVLLEFERARVPIAVQHQGARGLIIGNSVAAGSEADLVPPEYALAGTPNGSFVVHNPAVAGPVTLRLDGRNRLIILCPRGESVLLRLDRPGAPS